MGTCISTMKGGHYVISWQSHTFPCNYGIIILVTAKIAIDFASCKFCLMLYAIIP